MFSPSTYIVDRNPSKFGGKQGDFVERSKAVIALGLRKISEAPKDEKGLQELFFTLLEDFGKARGEIARAHGTKCSEEFGRRRVEDGNSDFYSTYLDKEYAGYNNQILRLLAEHVRGMNIERKIPGRAVKKIEDPATGSSFDIEVLDSEDLARHQWDRRIARTHFPASFPLDLLEKREKLITLDRAEIQRLKEAVRQLKEEQPDLYKRFKMTTLLVNLQAEFPSPKVIPLPGGDNLIEGNESNLKSFYVLGTARLMVDGKRFAVTQYLTWLYRDFKLHPADRMLRDSTVMLIHQDKFLINDTLQEIAKIFARAVLWDKKEINDLKDQMALFCAYFSHAMPCERGSASVEEWFESLLFAIHGYSVEYTKEKMVNLEALSTPSLSEFVMSYRSIVTLKKLVQ